MLLGIFLGILCCVLWYLARVNHDYILDEDLEPVYLAPCIAGILSVVLLISSICSLDKLLAPEAAAIEYLLRLVG
jgi:hypothetical protein